jgi:membrane-bound lytic murein transglycosylase B
LRNEAVRRGISPETLDQALASLSPIERVIELDRQQPEFTQTFWTYLRQRVTEARIERGRELLREHRDLLGAIQRKYGVPARYLVAFWGLETSFGEDLGSFPVIGALATLAYDARRSQFFRAQLLDALQVVDDGQIGLADMRGSWAGAMGHLQFIPSTFRRYAVDATGDGRADVWHSLPDVFESGANYLKQLGWRPGSLWGREVRLPQDFDWTLASSDHKKTVSEWAALGVTKAHGANLPRSDTRGAIVLPQGHRGPAFLVYDNFEVIMKWNRSVSYAIAVGHLADRIAGLPGIQHGHEVDNRALSRQQVLEMQKLLEAQGFDIGAPDGIAGSRTRAAVREFQARNGLPADGYASAEFLDALRRRSVRH